MTQVIDYVGYGVVTQLYKKRPPGSYEILVEGPAGTGKTRGILEWLNYMAETYPGHRQLWLRQTRESLTESVLECWEEEVLWPNHPCIVGTAGKNNRQHYTYPRTEDGRKGTHIVLGGLDKPSKTFSTQYDIIVVFEAREISMDSYNWLARANRNGKLPAGVVDDDATSDADRQVQIRVMDTNPAGAFHWINKSFPEGVRRVLHPEEAKTRLLSRHRDNPVFWNHVTNEPTPRGAAYVWGTLQRLPGAQYRNLFKGEWASEEGTVWDYDPAIHLIDPQELPDIRWCFASFDKGTRHPGCLQVWAVDSDDRMYRVAEVFKTQQTQDWWADRVMEYSEKYDLKAVVCDPSSPDYIMKFNDRLGTKGGKRIAMKANNDLDSGIATVEWGFSQEKDGPRIFLVRGALEHGRDMSRDDAIKPACTEEELPSYVWPKSEDGRPMKEKPDQTCSDHGCDCLRYAAMYRWKRDLGPREEPPKFPQGTLGDIFGHDKYFPRRPRQRKWRGI